MCFYQESLFTVDNYVTSASKAVDRLATALRVVSSHGDESGSSISSITQACYVIVETDRNSVSFSFSVPKITIMMVSATFVFSRNCYLNAWEVTNTSIDGGLGSHKHINRRWMLIAKQLLLAVAFQRKLKRSSITAIAC